MLSTRKFLHGSASYIVRLALAFLVGLVLPPVLVRHLSQAEYSAWVLILQLGTYVNLLDLGMQTVVAKFVAEYHATGDRDAGHRVLSSSFSLLSIAALLGAVLTCIMVWRIPQLFHQMPAHLLPQVRFSLFIIGLSFSFALPFSPFLSAFTGLQEYGFPTVLSVFSRSATAVVLIALALCHSSLAHMAAAMVLVNVTTALAQFLGWKRYASQRLHFSFFFMDRQATAQLLRSGGILTIWTLGGLLVSGLDTVIVGHFDYAHTGFYAIAVTATNLMIFIVGSLFAPLLPAVSAMQTTSTPTEIGDLTIRSSRYSTLILCMVGLSLLVGAYPLLALWVGHDYAAQGAIFLQILVLGNLVRQMIYPYAVIVMATDTQRLATLATVSEAIVNVSVSIFLARKIGAVGVAIGTVVGAFVSMGLHLTVSMRLTRSAIDLSRWNYVRQGLLRPLACIFPLFLLIPSWTANSMLPADRFALAIWLVTTLLIAYLFGLTPSDRQTAHRRLQKLLRSAKTQSG
jgi:O-antigen/teichoic acid export membrane protein